MSRKTIGKTLREARLAQNLNQQDIASLLRCSRPRVSDIENGKYQGSLQLLERYVKLMGFTLTIIPQEQKRPTLDELEDIYEDD